MSFAGYTLANGEPVNVTAEYVCAVKQLPGNTQARVWSISPSKPGSSDGYVTVQGSFLSVLSALSIIPLQVFNEQGTGVKIAINAAFCTRVEGLPGNTACRVSWASNGAAGYAIVDGDIATVSSALFFNPPGPVPPRLTVTGRIQFTAVLPVWTQIAAVYSPFTIATPTLGEVVFDSAAGPSVMAAGLRVLGTPTYAATWAESIPAVGERVQQLTTFAGISPGWYMLEARLLSGPDGGCFGMQVEG